MIPGMSSCEKKYTGLTTTEIEMIIAKDHISAPYFRGAMARDELNRIAVAKVNIPQFYISNTDNLNKKGEHWVGFGLFPNGTVEFFDSAGLPINSYPLEFKRFASKNGMETVEMKRRLQGNLPSCGHYCVLYIMNRCRKVPMKDIFKNTSNARLIDDKSVMATVNSMLDKPRNFTSCPRDQSCVPC